LLIVEVKNTGIAIATASIFNEEYRQKMFVGISRYTKKAQNKRPVLLKLHHFDSNTSKSKTHSDTYDIPFQTRTSVVMTIFEIKAFDHKYGIFFDW